MHLQMVLGERRSHLLELADDPPQSVARLTPSHQDRVRGGHNDHVLDAKQGDELFLGGDVGATRVDEDRRTMRSIVSRFVRRQFPDGLPGATSDQPHDTGMTVARAVRSITA